VAFPFSAYEGKLAEDLAFVELKRRKVEVTFTGKKNEKWI